MAAKSNLATKHEPLVVERTFDAPETLERLADLIAEEMKHGRGK